MDIVKMHSITSDSRLNKERLIELKTEFYLYKETLETRHALQVMKNCLSLVNDVLEYSSPIKLDEYYKRLAQSFLDDESHFFSRFDYDHGEFMKNGLHNDLAPRFYCKDWFSTVVGVLVLNGMTIQEIEHRYFSFIINPTNEQMTIFEFVS